MVQAHSSTFLLSSFLLALIALSQDPALIHVNAAPISRLLSIIPPYSSSPASIPLPQPLNAQPLRHTSPFAQPSHGRARIRRVPTQRLVAHQRRALPVESPDQTGGDPDKTSYILHQSPQQSQPQQQQYPQQQQQESSSPIHTRAVLPEQWSDRTLEGHAVLDDDDDDAGNELLDTEADNMFRPDADEEVDGTIEGELLEEDEEEDDGAMDEGPETAEA
ncbi:hypothetical protein BC939DRAFT_451610 [Gamsiella multidivaricata]|uniref:uncharacterized protein n=1 Tax=Gamsiella multidivaricata TaxID=101098 RepID=UPI00221F7DCF|nr:uncharacterized protein BC939DRAFT_451610 [Gamsiella multidivaricata]KAI7823288.1 hypothetical protein BC939DRAFT_451610 [Gamsiella multidivaricata]